MNYDWKKMKLKCTVKLSRPIDPSYMFNLEAHLVAFPETAQVRITVKLLQSQFQRATGEAGGGHGLSSSGPEET